MPLSLLIAVNAEVNRYNAEVNEAIKKGSGK